MWHSPCVEQVSELVTTHICFQETEVEIPLITLHDFSALVLLSYWLYKYRRHPLDCRTEVIHSFETADYISLVLQTYAMKCGFHFTFRMFLCSRVCLVKYIFIQHLLLTSSQVLYLSIRIHVILMSDSRHSGAIQSRGESDDGSRLFFGVKVLIFSLSCW